MGLEDNDRGKEIFLAKRQKQSTGVKFSLVRKVSMTCYRVHHEPAVRVGVWLQAITDRAGQAGDGLDGSINTTS